MKKRDLLNEKKVSPNLIILFLICLQCSFINAQNISRTVGNKSFELSNHLENVTTVVNDRKISTSQSGSSIIEYTGANIISYSDYYPYGMLMEGRNGSEGYRYGFQGQERDDEIMGTSNTSNFAYRIYNTRLGKWMSIDPLTREYPQSSPFLFTNNSPLYQIDSDGRKAKVIIKRNENGGGTIEITTKVYVSGLQNRIESSFISMLNKEATEILKDGSYTDKEGNTWDIKVSINYEAGEKSNSKEDKFFNNQLNVSDLENKASAFLGEGNITKNTIKKAIKGNKDKIGTILEESIHFLGLGDQYDIVVEGFEEKQIGFIPKVGYDDDVLTGAARKTDYHFSEKHFFSFGSYFEKKGLLFMNNTTETTILNTRISGGIKKIKKNSLSLERKKKIIRRF